MKKTYIRDLKKRNLFLKNFLRHHCLKSLHSNLNLSQQIRWESFILLQNSSKNTRSTQLKNRCILSNRGKSIDSQFKISRILIRKLVSNGLISGLLKSSW